MVRPDTCNQREIIVYALAHTPTHHAKSMSQFDNISELFKDALCPNEIGFTDDGYLSVCFTNTYLYAPISVALVLWAITETRNLNTNHHSANSITGSIKFLLTAVYCVTVFIYGAEVFNAISQLTSMLTGFIVFVLSFCDFKGVQIPQKPLEVYFFLIAAVTGYFVVHKIGTQQYDTSLLASVYLCLISSLSGSARNIISAFEDAQSEVKKPKSQ